MTIDTELTLDMLRVQLLRLEHEISTLQRIVEQMQESQPKVPGSFESLAGAWKGVIVNDEDFEAARLTVPEDI